MIYLGADLQGFDAIQIVSSYLKSKNIVTAFINSEYDGSEKRLKMFEEFDKWH